jgi:hypothetical protein
MKSIIFKDFPLGDDGLQVLAHALQTCRYQYLSLEACNLTDICIPSLIGIIKVRLILQFTKSLKHFQAAICVMNLVVELTLNYSCM